MSGQTDTQTDETETAMDEHDDLRRRVEHVEQGTASLAVVMRENTMMLARLNETVIEFKADMVKIHSLEKGLNQLEFGFAAIKWLATEIGASPVVLVMAYLFKTQAL